MNEQYKAKPTIFNDVLYRSKSEAKLAVCFDSWGWSFTYETVSVHSWKADFTVRNKSCIRVIEYKPTMPTDEYLRDLSSNFFKVMKAAKANPLLHQTTLFCELWCVDFWNGTSSGLRFNLKSFPFSIDHELSTYDFSPGKDFRFDLRSSSQSYEYTKSALERMRRNANSY